jgi:hypothetical protein
MRFCKVGDPARRPIPIQRQPRRRIGFDPERKPRSVYPRPSSSSPDARADRESGPGSRPRSKSPAATVRRRRVPVPRPLRQRIHGQRRARGRPLARPGAHDAPRRPTGDPTHPRMTRLSEDTTPPEPESSLFGQVEGKPSPRCLLRVPAEIRRATPDIFPPKQNRTDSGPVMRSETGKGDLSSLLSRVFTRAQVPPETGACTRAGVLPRAQGTSGAPRAPRTQPKG